MMIDGGVGGDCDGCDNGGGGGDDGGSGGDDDSGNDDDDDDGDDDNDDYDDYNDHHLCSKRGKKRINYLSKHLQIQYFPHDNFCPLSKGIFWSNNCIHMTF